MIHEIIDHPHISAQFDVVDELAQIDLTKDIVICFNPFTVNDNNQRVLRFDVDQFTIHNHEQYRANPINSVLTYSTFPRVKISLPFGLVPEFESLVPGMNIRAVSFDKLQGIELKQHLKTDNVDIDLTAEHGRYSFYHNIKITYSVFDQKMFATNKFVGNHIPIDQALCNLRLSPHFLGDWNPENFNNIYVICSKYIFSRLPNF